MANPSLSDLLHADPAAPQPQSQSQSHAQPQAQPQAQLGHFQPRSPQSQTQSFPPQQSSGASNPSTGLAPIPASSYLYPPPPSEPSPAASGSTQSLATPATSPTAPAVQAPSDASRAYSSHAPSSSLYQCADCLKKYSRPEHLQRHVATHTLGKRFVCDVCKKAFARADLLKRHRTNHDDDSNGTKRRRINSSPGAGRVAHACQACARARVKCEELKPCTRCRNRNLTCEYASSEAGSAAAMHLLHLSASGHSGQPGQSQSPSTRTPAAPFGAGSRNLSSEPLPSQIGEPGPMQTVPVPTLAAPSITNQAYAQSSGSSPATVTTHGHRGNEAASLPTPEDIMEHRDHTDCYQTQLSQNQSMVDMTRQQFGDFLSHVLYDQQQRQQQQMDPSGLAASSRMAEAPGLAVLDFCDDANLDMNELDFGMLDNWNLGNLHGIIATDPNLANYVSSQPEDSADMSHMRQRLVSMWAESPWRWMPDGTKDNIQAEKSNLPLSDIHSSHLQTDKVIGDEMEPSGRDKILAIVLSTIQNNAMMGRVASSFPSTQVMDSLVHVFLAWHLCQVSEFVHFGSFSMNVQCPEWLGVTAAAGAILTPLKSLRKFGYALQEAVRITIPMRFEDNNSNIQDISLVQALVLNHDIGLWSGNRRRMEIAECHLNIPIAMTRGRGIFQQSYYPPTHVDPTDEGAVLEDKWKNWCRKESWKRLIFHLFIRDAQTSMTSMINPHISYAELTLPLPEARELWFAKTAQEWKIHYLQRHAGAQSRMPSLGDLFRDFNLLATESPRIDVQYAISIFLHGFWSFIREYRQLCSVHRWSTFSPTLGCDPTMLLAPRHAEHVKVLELFQTNFAQNWPHMLFAQENMVLSLLLMNLHVSLEDLQLFSGKEGDEQAKRILPALQRWVQVAESRRAIWYAGQVLRWAREFPTGHLKDFSAIAVHHAALALWTWGVVMRAMRRSGTLPSGFNQQNDPVIYLDAPESAQVQTFFMYGTGTPAIRGARKNGTPGQVVAGANGNNALGGGAMNESLVEEPRMCMDLVEEIFRTNFRDGQVAPIVENLCHLSKQLGRAAGAVGLG